MSSPWAAFLDLLFPPKCVFCGELLKQNRSHGMSICPDCGSEIPVLSAPFTRNTLRSSVDVWYAPLVYEDKVRESLHRYKFSGKSLYAETYGTVIFRSLGSGALDCDLVTWVPLSRARKRKRGYDQARCLAQELSRLTGIPCERTLVKTKNIRPQSSLKTAGERQNNIRDVYRLRAKTGVAGKCILLVDDIITTGATMNEAASVLKASGAGSVKAVAVARV